MAEEFSSVNNQIYFPRDFLKVFSGSGFSDKPRLLSAGDGGVSDEVELRLGLSLGGCFGAAEKGTLVRSSSSSIASVSVLSTEKGKVQNLDSTALARACSLPAEIDEGHRTTQSPRKLEAKRKKREERRNASNGSTVGSSQGSGSSSASDSGSLQSSEAALGGLKMPRSRSFSLSSEKKTPSFPRDNESRRKVSALVVSEAIAGGSKPRVDAFKEEEHNMNMPCVSAKGSGPGGRTIQGFLYKYRKGEDVSIVCVCHGKFLTPAEFVKHAGGGDVAHPLKHIVVNPSPVAF